MLERKIQDALNDQMIFEMFSANIYLSMATWFDAKNLTGFSNWMKIQYKEEMFHAMKFYNYIDERGGRVLMLAIDAPPTDWESPAAVLENALEHERLVTKRIHDILALATEEKDFATMNFIQWYVAEQVEEEASVQGILDHLELIEGAPGGLLMIDRELAQRTYNAPATEEGE